MGADGISVVTTKSVVVPGVDQSANPPALGEAAIPAQAQHIGSRGNIAAYDINGTVQHAAIHSGEKPGKL